MLQREREKRCDKRERHSSIDPHEQFMEGLEIKRDYWQWWVFSKASDKFYVAHLESRTNDHCDQLLRVRALGVNGLPGPSSSPSS
jgi:hypothetical protein